MLWERFGWLVVMLAVIWGVVLVNMVSGYGLNPRFGLIPRTWSGLDGVLFMPFLHGSMSHAVANTLPLAGLGAVMAVTARDQVLMASLLIVGLGGLAVWVLGSMAVHVGASGLIFGWFGFLLARGIVERRLVPLATTLAVTAVYGTMLWGVLPGQPGVSWESHLFGAAAGGLAAYVLRRG